ncbi:MAG: SEL1-like repeat protein [Methylobacter sp.]|nr:SEL1-like repeat protein [Methylobacter sp.]
MTSLLQKINLITLAFVINASLSLVACADKPEGNSQVEALTAPESEDKIAQLQREAQDGDPDAQYSLAYLYENGLGLPKDEAKALELYQKAADQGHSDAQNNLDALRTSK